MTERRGCKVWSREKLAEMTTEELSALLRTDLEAPAGQEADPELLLCVMEELACRRNPEENEKTPQEAWIAFQQDYLPEDEDAEAAEAPVKRRVLSLRRAVAIAAVVAVLVCIPLVSFAGGWQALWNATAKWTKDTFFFDRSGKAETTQPSTVADDYGSLQQALTETGWEGKFLPTWIPDGFELDEIIVDESPVSNAYIGVYRCEEKIIEISAIYEGRDGQAISEKSEGAVEIYETADNRYYIFNNEDRLCAIWVYDGYECYIFGNLTVEEIKLMIDSIGKE